MADEVEVSSEAVFGEAPQERGVEVHQGLGPTVSAEVSEPRFDAPLSVWRELAGLREPENKGSGVVVLESLQSFDMWIWFWSIRYPPPIGG